MADIVQDYLKRLMNNTLQEREAMTDDSAVGYIERPSEMKDRIEQSIGMMKIGKHNDVPDSEFLPDELEKGIQVEHEHTDCPHIAKAIAKDHLSECPRYYTKLAEMEANCDD